MKLSYLSGAYQYSNTALHHTPVGQKLSILVFYGILLLTDNQLLSLALLYLLLWLGAKLLRLRDSNWISFLVISILSISFARLTTGDMRVLFISNIFTLITKVLIVNALVRWYGQVTSVEMTFDWLQKRTNARWAIEWSFMVSMMLGLYPGIQRDLNRAVEAEQLRLGRRPAWWMGTIWFRVFTHTLVRIIKRAHNLGTNIIERDFILGKPLTPLIPLDSVRSNWRLILLCLLPGVIALGVRWIIV